ncbi:MAG: FAD-binding oxidoreductase [Terrimonas sp.]|nr:FAD-binding oxidoreductase [Terrimonas sp.]OJY95775.1 MAG: FAD-dependent oxidoreductase [Sphingobacteriales bacterium 40-81]
MKNIVIVGGGIMGLSSAFYLQKSGHNVTVIDKNDFLNNCSYGNAGYVCPSHFVPLATPGIVWQGFKWMFNSQSPFYVQPSVKSALIDWGLKFVKSANDSHVAASAIPLRDIALLSQKEYEKWQEIPGFDFAYEHKGLLEIFQTEPVGEHAYHTVEKAKAIGLDTVLLNAEELQQLEPQTKINALGAILFKCDAHLYPQKLMHGLLNLLKQSGVRLIPNEAVIKFEKKGNSINKVITAKNAYDADYVVIATGAWSREIAALADTKIPLMPGRGYSITLENSPYKINHPAVLMEGRVALTPMDGNKIRFGGTMEVVPTSTPPRYKRVEGIVNAVKRYYTAFDIPMPAEKDIWYGYRPCSADGLPYIGKIKKYNNVVVATGHAMIGLSTGAGTGKLVSEIVNGEKPSMDIKPFEVERFD